MYDFAAINTGGGSIVRSIGNGERAYVGRDGFWARRAENATPFKTMAEARAVESALAEEDDRVHGRKRNHR
jgi:hypothetical protein